MNVNYLILFALVTACFYGAYNVLIKMASGYINQILGAVILQVVAAIVGGIIFFVLKMTTNTPIIISTKGVVLAVLAGIFVGLAEITSFYVFSKGLTASIGIPIIIGGSILIGAIAGILFLKESLNPIHYFAILLIVIGVVILSTK
jgi:bacterial/archaeal transporter family protein